MGWATYRRRLTCQVHVASSVLVVTQTRAIQQPRSASSLRSLLKCLATYSEDMAEKSPTPSTSNPPTTKDPPGMDPPGTGLSEEALRVIADRVVLKLQEAQKTTSATGTKQPAKPAIGK